MLTAHPSSEMLSRLVGGRLPEDEVESVAEHMEQCPECQSALSALDRTDTLLTALRQPLQPEPHSTEPECAAVLAAFGQELLTRLALAHDATPHPGSTADWHSPMPQMMESFPDRPCTFGARYVIERHLGKGGMGSVYLAFDNTLARFVALKVSRFALTQPQESERFLREARAAAAVRHEGICRLLDFGVLDGTHYFTMDYIEGESLSQQLKAHQPPEQRRAADAPREVEILRDNAAHQPPEQRWAADLVRQVARAMDAAHGRGVVHRDLKPGNVMLDANAKPHVVDFGLARQQEDETLTKPGQIPGTPAYMSPEQVRGDKIDFHTDIYSLGVILYELLTGQRPFPGPDPTQLVYQIIHAPLKRPSEHRPDIDGVLEAICLKAMARDISERYASMAALAADLDAYLHDAATVPPLSTPQETTTKPRQSPVRKKQSGEIQRPAQKKTSQPPQSDLGENPAIDLRGERPQETKSQAPKPRRSSRRLAVGCSVSLTVAVVLFTCLLPAMLAFWSANVFKVKTKDGTVVLANLPPDADVTVDGETVSVKSSDGKTFEIRVDPGKKHRLEVKKAGFKMFGEEVEVNVGGRKSVVVRLEPETISRAAPTPKSEDKENWVPLFNGKDLTGWMTHPKQPGNWHVANGILIGSGPSTSHLYTKRDDYKDFHLRAEARINDGGNSGIYFRTPFGPFGQSPWLTGYEALINGTQEDPRKTGSLIGKSDLVVKRESPVPPGAWFALEVIAEGNHFVLKVNGKTTVDYTDEQRQFTSGHIAVQQLNAQTVAEFRKIEIKELPASK